MGTTTWVPARAHVVTKKISSPTRVESSFIMEKPGCRGMQLWKWMWEIPRSQARLHGNWYLGCFPYSLGRHQVFCVCCHLSEWVHSCWKMATFLSSCTWFTSLNVLVNNLERYWPVPSLPMDRLPMSEVFLPSQSACVCVRLREVLHYWQNVIILTGYPFDS